MMEEEEENKNKNNSINLNVDIYFVELWIQSENCIPKMWNKLFSQKKIVIATLCTMAVYEKRHSTTFGINT